MAKRKTRGRAKLMLLEADHRTIGLYHLNPTIEADEFLDHEDPPPLVVHHLNRVRKDDVGTVMAWSIELLKQAGLSAADVHCFRARADEIVGLARDGKRGESLVAAIDFGMRVQAALLAPLDDPATNTVRQKLGAPKGGQANAKRSRELAPSWQKKSIVWSWRRGILIHRR